MDQHHLRIVTKLALLAEQNNRCVLCGKRDPNALHEWALKRGDLPKKRQEELANLLFSEINCVVLHNNPCHLAFGQTRWLEVEVAHYKQDQGHDVLAHFAAIRTAIPTWTSAAWDKKSNRLVGRIHGDFQAR